MPFSASHTFASAGLFGSLPPVTIRLPSGLNTTLRTGTVWPLRAKSSWPLSASHTCSRFLTADNDAFAIGAERHAGHIAGVSSKSGLVAVEQRPEVSMLPAAQVPLALLDQSQCLCPPAVLPHQLRLR